MAIGRLDAQFTWSSKAPLQEDLQQLMKALEARFEGLEALSGSFEGTISEFQTLGLQRLNEVLTPLASEAIARLQDVTSLFSATSPSSVAIPASVPASLEFLIPVDQRGTFVPTPYLAIYATTGENGVIAKVTAFDRPSGILTVDALTKAGSGTFSSWTITVSPLPSAGGYTRGDTDAAIASAVSALSAVLTPEVAALTTILGVHVLANIGAQPAATTLTVLAALTPGANQLPYFSGTSSAALAAISAFVRGILNSADGPTFRAAIGIANPISLSASDQVLTGGVLVTALALGTKSSGTVTPDPGARPLQNYTNNGAHILAPGTNVGSYLLDVLNGASAGAITTSGWTKVTGDAFDTTNAHKFRCACSIGPNGSLLVVQAMQ